MIIRKTSIQAPGAVRADETLILKTAEEMESYDKPAAFLHGDTRRFRIDHSFFGTKTIGASIISFVSRLPAYLTSIG